MPSSNDIILHHYDASPFSHKVRLLLGLKGIGWKSVLTPNMMPKPDLLPLTGGYRRAPVMQVGADVYCDSQVIMAEIERRFPSPRADLGAGWPVNLWADRLWFQQSVAIIFGLLGDQVDPAFIKDREKLSGRPFDVKAMAAFAEPAKGQWRAQAAWLDEALSASTGGYLFGNSASIGDLAAYMNIWFLAGTFPDVADELLEGLDHVLRWRERIDAIGQGDRCEIEGSEAIALAAATTPEDDPPVSGEALPSGMALGDHVFVSADDYGRDPIAGTLLAAGTDRVVIRRNDPAAGALNIHFPRVGFVIGKAG